MVNQRISTFPWIIIIVVILVLAQLVNCKKHRASHSQSHQRYHHQHRKPHAKFHHHHQHHHLPSMNTYSRSITTNNSNIPANMTTVLRSPNSLLNESSNLPPPESNFSKNQNIKSTFYFGYSNNNSAFDPHETFNISGKEDSKVGESTDFSIFWNSTVDFNLTTSSTQIYNVSNSYSTVKKLQYPTFQPSSSTSSSTLRSVVDYEKTTENFLSFENRIKINDDSKNSTFNQASSELTNVTNELITINELKSPEIKEYEKIYSKATEENVTEFSFVTNSSRLKNTESLETVTDQLILSTKNNATMYNRQKFIKELEALFGSTKEPRDFTDVETPSVVLVRRKRSNRKKEEEEEEEPKIRTLLDFNGPDMSDESQSFEDFSNVVHKRVKRNDPLYPGENPYELDPNYLQDLEDSFAPSALEVQAQKADEELARKSQRLNDSQLLNNKLKFKRDTSNERYEENIENDPAMKIKQNSGNSEQQQMDEKNVLTDSSMYSPDKLSQNDGFTTKKDFSEMDSSVVTLFGLNQSESTTLKSDKRRQNREDDELLNEQKSVFNIEHLQDDNSVSRNLLGDVYSNIFEDSQPESLVPLVRIKRFGDGSVDRGPLSVRYANEQPDSGKMVLEPYAEDNKVIDSMLNKVDSRFVEEGRDDEVDEQSEDSLRDKRGTGPLTRSKRRFGGYRKHKKKRRRKKKKKKHRYRVKDYKKSAPLLSNHEYKKEVAQSKRDWSKDDRDNFHEIDDQDVISFHDGRRRRDDEDEANDNLHYNIEQPALGQVLRKLRESDDYRKDLSADDRRRSPEEPDKIVNENTSREKRTCYDGDVNGTSQISDKNLNGPKIDEPIRDIKDLIQKLLVKVNELHGYINHGTADAETNKNTHNSKTAKKFSSIIDTPKVIPESNIAEKPMSKSDNSMIKQRCRKSCWEYPESDRRGSKNHRPLKCIDGDRRRIRRKGKSGRKWGRWTAWSGCSVTCGKGRQIRWRHCLRNCSKADTEMEEKACQFPACPPAKFLGIFG